MPALTHKTTHTAEALARLTSKWRDKANVQALVASLIDQVQDFEDMIDGLRSSQTIEGALAVGGVPLDALGALVGQAREGLSDESYARHIRARIRVNRSQGLIEDAHKIFRALFPDRDARQVVLVPEYPAAFLMEVTGATTSAEAEDAHGLLQEGAKAGVRVGLVYSEFEDAETFTLSTLQDTLQTSATLGLADVAQTTGGHLAGAL